MAQAELEGQWTQINAHSTSATSPLKSIQPEAGRFRARKKPTISKIPWARSTPPRSAVSVPTARMGCDSM